MFMAFSLVLTSGMDRRTRKTRRERLLFARDSTSAQAGSFGFMLPFEHQTRGRGEFLNEINVPHSGCNCNRRQRNLAQATRRRQAAQNRALSWAGADPLDVRALAVSGGKFLTRFQTGVSSNPKGDLERADELVSKALALDPNWTAPHSTKGNILRFQGRTEEAVPEDERALALDPSNLMAVVDLGFDYEMLGQFDKGLEYFDKAILLSPHDPFLAHFYLREAGAMLVAYRPAGLSTLEADYAGVAALMQSRPRCRWAASEGRAADMAGGKRDRRD
jgi:tetratricopeptide (TPR) repeat protein